MVMENGGTDVISKAVAVTVVTKDPGWFCRKGTGHFMETNAKQAIMGRHPRFGSSSTKKL